MKNTMLAAVYHGVGDLRLEKRPVPILREARDAIVRVTRSTICTSDLHILRGAVPRARPGITLGHEFVGEIVETGDGISSLKPGDRVAANCETFCGECWFCRRGYVNNCEKGGWELGCRIDGCQAEYVRVPFADTGLTRLPDTVSDEDALFLGDILSSAYWGAQLAEIRDGDTVAVIGAGPVGLCAAQCVRLLGAGTVIVLEPDAFRRQTALENHLADVTLEPGTEAIQHIRGLTGGRGADAIIEAAGATDTFSLAWRIARPNAVVVLVAMYEQPQVLPLPEMYGKNLIFKTGGVDACRCGELLGHIAAGRLRTDFLITHRAPLADIAEGYRVFGGRLDRCIKWVVTP